MDFKKKADSHEEFGMDVDEDDEVGSSANHITRKLHEQIIQGLETVDTSQKLDGGTSEPETLKRGGSALALLMSKFRVLENQKAALEREVALLRRRNMVLEEQILSSRKQIEKDRFKEETVVSSGKSKTADQIIVIDDESTVNQLITENDVLRCEKKFAEMEAATWKQKCSDLESRLLLLLGENLNLSRKEVTSIDFVETNMVTPQYRLVSKGEYGVPQSGNINTRRDTGVEVTPVKPAHNPVNVSNDYEGLSLDAGTNSRSRGRKRLSFVDTELSRKKVAPSTPAALRPNSNLIIDLIDSDEEQGALPSSRDLSVKVSDVSTPTISETVGDDKLKASGIMVEDDNEEDMSSSIHFLATPKRKRTLKLVASDSEAEDGDDDNVPLSQVFRKNFQQADLNTTDIKVVKPYPGSDSADDESSKTNRRRRLLKKSVLEERRGTQQIELHLKTDATMNVDSDQLHLKTDATTNVDSDDEAEVEGDVSANLVKLGREGSHDIVADDINSGIRRSQRLLKMRKREKRRNQPTKYNQSGISQVASVNIIEDDSNSGTEDDADSDCLKDFIVDDDDDIDGDDAGGGVNSVAAENDSGSKVHSGEHTSSESEIDLDEILDRIKRGKKNQAPMEWVMVGDMLAAFGKDLELCMKAVCALCRRQTNDEQQHEEAFVANGRGFSKFDAARGTKLAKFLTDEDLDGEVRKSVDELRRYDPEGPELCRTLAIRYSKQLFDIYLNEEDAYFRPPNF